MNFLIEKADFSVDSVQQAVLLQVLDHYKYEHHYKIISNEDFYKKVPSDFGVGTDRIRKSAEDFDADTAKYIPFGNMSFVENFLSIFYGISYENAIEIPPVLRQERFLKRKYSIVPVWEIPGSGHYFIKDATRQKQFSYMGNLEDYLQDEMFEPRTMEFDTSFRFDYEHLYQVSEIVTVLAEYRVYVLDGRINCVVQYKGNPLIFPDGDLIREAVTLYAESGESPKSWSMDVMVTPVGTAVLEVHNFMCLGLYTVDWDEDLLYALRDGLDYVLYKNVPQTEFSNF